MYTEEPRKRINWGNIIKKGILALLLLAVIFLVVWAFSKNKNKSNDVNVNYDNTTTPVLNEDVYSKEFIDGYRYYHDTAKEYFLVSELPEEGKTIKYTLKELANKNLVLLWSYKDNKACDTEKSYVTVTKQDGKYTMTTTLVCGTEKATTNEELGCNQICVDKINCKCNCSETEYEYKQAYRADQTVSTCQTGYTLSNGKCYKKTTVTKKASVNTSNDSCPTGYTQEGDKCYKIVYDYTCPIGYKEEGSGENLKCYKASEVTYTYEKATLVTYTSCPSGYKQENGKCVYKTENITAKPEVHTTSACPSGYEYNGSSCVKYIYTTVSYGRDYQGCTGGNYITSKCTTNGNCSEGYYVYYCSSGIKTITTYTCPAGFDHVSGTGANMVCQKPGTTYEKDLITTSSYTCNKGELTSNNTCKVAATSSISYIEAKKTERKEYLDTTLSSKTTYSCEDGYTKSGNGSNTICTKLDTTDVKNATKTTKKVTKYNYKWSKETSLEGWERTGKTRTASSK